MASRSVRERQIQTSLTCRKCGSRAIVSDNDHNALAGKVHALKCLICGNRQEKGVPCRWPFFEGDIGNNLQVGMREGVESKSVNDGIDLVMAEEPRKRKKRAKKTRPKIAERGLSL